MNWIYFEEDQEGGRITEPELERICISRVKTRGFRTRSRSDPVQIQSTFVRTNIALQKLKVISTSDVAPMLKSGVAPEEGRGL